MLHTFAVLGTIGLAILLVFCVCAGAVAWVTGHETDEKRATIAVASVLSVALAIALALAWRAL